MDTIKQTVPKHNINVANYVFLKTKLLLMMKKELNSVTGRES